jgi:ribosomal protein S18 acetylase RimI-like enzyme
VAVPARSPPAAERADYQSCSRIDAEIREYHRGDEEDVVRLSLRAWAPVFASFEEVLGTEISTRLHGTDWRAYQAKSVRGTLSDLAVRAWVADKDAQVRGFVAATVRDQERLLGEVVMLAVDPEDQGRGLGTALTDHATAWLRQSGMRVAMIGTGGDRGHAPARRVYEKADYRLIPLARYFKAL